MKFTKAEEEFLQSLEEARIATSHEDIPHVKPVSFMYHNNTIVVATDYETRTFTNIKSNSRASIAIDIYKSEGIKLYASKEKQKSLREIQNLRNYTPYFTKNLNG